MRFMSHESVYKMDLWGHSTPSVRVAHKNKGNKYTQGDIDGYIDRYPLAWLLQRCHDHVIVMAYFCCLYS